MRIISFALVASFSSMAGSAHADFEACPQFFYKGQIPKIVQAPASASKLRALCFDSFAVMHSGVSKTPLYVVEKLNRAQLQEAKGEERTDRFYEEARLPSAERAHLADYKEVISSWGNSKDVHFDRGHNAPAGDMPNPEAMAQSFSLANMIPQAPAFNRGIWAKNVEKPTRQYAMRASGDIYVFTGTVFGSNVQTIGTSKVWVPEVMYKLVYDPNARKAWAYWLPNLNEARMSAPISYEELVKRTGIAFIPGI